MLHLPWKNIVKIVLETDSIFFFFKDFVYFMISEPRYIMMSILIFKDFQDIVWGAQAEENCLFLDNLFIIMSEPLRFKSQTLT